MKTIHEANYTTKTTPNLQLPEPPVINYPNYPHSDRMDRYTYVGEPYNRDGVISGRDT